MPINYTILLLGINPSLPPRGRKKKEENSVNPLIE